MTLAVFGQGLLVAALVCAILGFVSAVWTTHQRGPGSSFVALLRASAALSTLAFLTLVWALVQGRFDLKYVAARTSLDLPLFYRISAVWSGQEGSLLLWLAMLSVFTAAVLRTRTRAQVSARMFATCGAVLATTMSFFGVLVVAVARPFAHSSTVVTDGAGMSPALQNYWMAIHPPALYVGYVTIAVPFALVIGALVAREPGDKWVLLTRRWALVAWIGLGCGLVLGGRWAYEEIGWGGYWAWDPVENAALMPWLTLTAYIHTIMVQERRGMLRFWNASLIALTFCLSIFGTFLTRSGVLSSVHSFVSSPVGWWFIGFLVLAIATSLLVLFVRRDYLEATGTVGSIISKEVTFLVGNLLLVSMTLMVLWGVLYPILTESTTGSRIALQRPWYDTLVAVVGMPLFVVMGLAPLVSWRQDRVRTVARAALPAAIVAVVAGGLFAAAGFGGNPAALAAMSLGAFVFATSLQELRRLVGRRRRSADVTTLGALRLTAGRDRRRFGGYVAHAGVGMLIIAITGSSAYIKEKDATLERGERASLAGWAIQNEGSTRQRTSTSMQVRATFGVYRHDKRIGTMEAGRNFYPVTGETSSEVGIRPHLRSGSDLYVIVEGLDENGTADVRVLVNPLVNWVWIASLLMIAGGLLAAVPMRRASRNGEASESAVPLVSDRPGSSEPLLSVLRSAD